MMIIKFVYNALNHSIEICHNLLHTKLNCMRSTCLENYQYFSYKYKLSDRDWYNDLEHLRGKMKISDLFRQKYIYIDIGIRDTLVFVICLMCWGGRLFLKGDRRLDLYCFTLQSY